MAARFTWPSFSRSARAPLQRFFPGRHRGIGREPGEDFGQIEARGGELLHDAFAAHARFLRHHARLFHRLARGVDARFGIQAFLVERAQRAVGLFERAPFGGELGFDLQAAREEILELAFELDDRQIAVGQRGFEFGAAHLRLRALIGHALEAHASSRSRSSAAIRCGSAGRGRRAAPPAKRARAACTASRRSSRSPSSAARRESSASSATRPRSSSARARASASWPRPDFTRDFRGLFFEALAAHGGFLRTGALAFELAQQVGMFAMRALDAALRLVAFTFRRREIFAAGGEARFHVAGILFAVRELDAQLFDALLALEHAGMRIAAAIDAQPVAAYPLARTGDDGFVVGELAAQPQRIGKRFREAHARQQPHDGAWDR